MVANGSLSRKGLCCSSNLHWLRCNGGKRIGVFIGGYEQKNPHNLITDSTYAAVVTVSPRNSPIISLQSVKNTRYPMELQILI